MDTLSGETFFRRALGLKISTPTRSDVRADMLTYDYWEKIDDKPTGHDYRKLHDALDADIAAK